MCVCPAWGWNAERSCSLARVSRWTHTSSPSLHACLWEETEAFGGPGVPGEGRMAGPWPRCLCWRRRPLGLPGRRCGWVESTGVRQRGRNVPRMLGAAYLGPGMRCSIISRRPSCLWNNHPGGVADICPVLPTQTVRGCLRQTSHGWSSRVCLCASVCACVHVSSEGCTWIRVGVCVDPCVCVHVDASVCVSVWIFGGLEVWECVCEESACVFSTHSFVPVCADTCACMSLSTCACA